MGERSTTYERPYLDACVWIDFLQAGAGGGEQQEARAHVAREIFEYAEEGNLQLRGSALVIVEVLHDPTIDDEGVQDLRAYFRRSSFIWQELTLPLAERARELARLHGLKPGDAVHLASAVALGADVLLSNDKGFTAGHVYEGVRAERPYFPFDRPLFQEAVAGVPASHTPANG